MITETNFKVSVLPKNPSKNLLKNIYKLNQENTPEVGSLASLNELEKLINMSANNYLVILDNSLIGFIVCLREGSKYKSKNYRYFCERLDKFLYIDRIAITRNFRRQGIGKAIYNQIQRIAFLNKIPLCCEIKTTPINMPSLLFHKKLGFKEVGQNAFDDNSVAYFIKNYK